MEPKFQTSFIPKKPLSVSAAAPAHHSVSVLMTLSVIVFILSLGGAGFCFAYEKFLAQQEVQYQAELAKDQDQFNTSLITTLSTANTKINLAENLLANHLDVAGVFAIVSQLTLQSVQWKSFTFTAPSSQNGGQSGASNNDVTISMQGEADSFYSIAYQSDVFGQSAQFGTNKVIKDPVLSNLSVQPNGKVDFTFTAMIDPSELSYTALVTGVSPSAAASTSPASP